MDAMKGSLREGAPDGVGWRSMRAVQNLIALRQEKLLPPLTRSPSLEREASGDFARIVLLSVGAVDILPLKFIYRG